MHSTKIKYTINNGALTLIHSANLPRATQDPLWLVKHVTSIRKGEHICDVGAGIGTVALLLAKQQPQAFFTGYDINHQLVQGAIENAEINHLDNCCFKTVDIFNNLPAEKFHHVVSNPPYHNTDEGFLSPHKQKQEAYGANTQQIQQWLIVCLQLTKKGGTCTLIHHTKNLRHLEPLLTNYHYNITEIITNPQRPAKRIIIVIQK